PIFWRRLECDSDYDRGKFVRGARPVLQREIAFEGIRAPGTGEAGRIPRESIWCLLRKSVNRSSDLQWIDDRIGLQLDLCRTSIFKHWKSRWLVSRSSCCSLRAIGS